MVGYAGARKVRNVVKFVVFRPLATVSTMKVKFGMIEYAIVHHGTSHLALLANGWILEPRISKFAQNRVFGVFMPQFNSTQFIDKRIKTATDIVIQIYTN